MSTVTARAPAHRTGWTITEGIVLVLIGIAAIVSPLITAEIAAALLPWLLLFEGILLFVAAFSPSATASRGWTIALAILSLIAAIAVFSQPFITLLSLPLMLGLYLLVKGIMQFVMGWQGSVGKAWFYTSAALNIVLAIFLLASPLGASIALTGFYIGASILLMGMLLLMLPGVAQSAAEDSDVQPIG